MTLDQLREMAKDRIDDGVAGGEIRPTILLIAQGQFFHFDYVGEEHQMDDMRKTITMMVTATRMAGTFEGCAMIAETWVSNNTSGIRPIDDPKRRENALMVLWQPPTREFRTWQLVREGKKISLGEEIKVENFTVWLDRAMQPLPDPLPASLKLGAEVFLKTMFTKKGVTPNG